MDSIRLKDSQIILAASQVIGIIAIFIDLQNSYKNSCSERKAVCQLSYENKSCKEILEMKLCNLQWRK